MEGISKMKERILRIIWEIENPATAQEISVKTGLKRRAVNTYLLGLRRAGFVTMSGDCYVITEKGKESIGLPKINKEMAEKILSKKPTENAFHFYTEVNQPLGLSSDSLTDLCEKIRMVNIKSIEFHVARGDFESWIRFLGDIELSERIRMLNDVVSTGEALREKLYETIRSRRDELLERVT